MLFYWSFILNSRAFPSYTLYFYKCGECSIGLPQWTEFLLFAAIIGTGLLWNKPLSHLMKILPPNTGNLAVFWYSEIFFFLVVLSLCSGKRQTWTVSTGGFVQVNPLLPNSPSVVHSYRITLLDCVCKSSAQWSILTHLQWAMNSYYPRVHPCSSQPALPIPKSTRAILQLAGLQPLLRLYAQIKTCLSFWGQSKSGSPERGSAWIEEPHDLNSYCILEIHQIKCLTLDRSPLPHPCPSLYLSLSLPFFLSSVPSPPIPSV